MATYKYVNDQDSLYKLQWDALYESIENNTYLPYKTSNLTNKSLNTTNKRIIKAVNEVLEKAETGSEMAQSFADRFNNVIGDEFSDPTLLTQLREIDENFFKAIIKINKQLQELSANGGGNSEGINKDVQAAIDELNSRVAELEGKEYVANHIEFPEIDYENQTFTLNNYPRTISSVMLFINGIFYSSKYFSVNEKTLIWLYDEKNEGFNVNENDFEVCVKYDYLITE